MNLTGTPVSAAHEALARLANCTVPALLHERVENEPHAIAIRYKQGGAFRELSWTAYLAEVRETASGLLGLGLAPGDRLAIMGEACMDYLRADVAALYIGAMPCGIYPTSSPAEVAHVVELSGARIFIAE